MKAGAEPPDAAAAARFCDLPADERRLLTRIPEGRDHGGRVGLQVARIALEDLDAACSLIKRGFVDLQVERRIGERTEARIVVTAAGRRVRDPGVG